MDNLVPILVALLGAGGLGVFAREVADIVTKLKHGVSAREGKRRTDIVAQRDAAVLDADMERRNRIKLQTFAARMERQLILAGIDPPSWPRLEEGDRKPKT